MNRSPLQRRAKPLKRSWLRPKKRVRRVLWRTGQVIEDAAGMMALRAAAYQRSGGKCECWRATGREACGQRVTWWSGQLHHIVPRARGGSDVIENVAFITRAEHDALHGKPRWGRMPDGEARCA